MIRIRPQRSSEDYRREVCAAINRLRKVHDSYQHRPHLVALLGNEQLGALFQLTSCQPAWEARDCPSPNRFWWIASLWRQLMVRWGKNP